eukprot:SAG31_NODE_2376_length_5841_cov_10.199060_1_plen_187_part_00
MPELEPNQRPADADDADEQLSSDEDALLETPTKVRSGLLPRSRSCSSAPALCSFQSPPRGGLQGFCCHVCHSLGLHLRRRRLRCPPARSDARANVLRLRSGCRPAPVMLSGYARAAVTLRRIGLPDCGCRPRRHANGQWFRPGRGGSGLVTHNPPTHIARSAAPAAASPPALHFNLRPVAPRWQVT